MSDSRSPTKVLLFGATGVIGKYILDQLVEAKSSFDKVGIFTSPGTAEKKGKELDGLKAKGVDVVVGDVNSEEDVKEAYREYDTVISALGRNVILAQIPLIKLAEASSTIHTFYPSEYGTDIEYAPSSAGEKPHQLKLQVRKHINESVKKLKITYLVTGPCSDLYIGKMSGEAEKTGTFDAKAKRAILLGSGKDRVSFTTMKDVGRLLVAALKTPTSELVRTLKVNSFTTTPDEILAEYEKQSGREWEVSYTSLHKLKELEKEATEKQNPMVTVYTLRRIWTEGGTLYETRDNGKIGNPPTKTLQEQVAKALQKEVAGFQSGAL